MRVPAVALTFSTLVALAGCAGAPATPPAELLLTGGRIHTFDAARSRVGALAIRGGRIVALGADGSDLASFVGPGTRRVDLGGRFVMPAFHDAHVHPMSAGVELGQCNLNGLATVEATLDAVRTCAAANQRPWLVGGGWDLTTFPPGRPGRQELDVLTGDTPAFLSSSDGHTVWVNSAALKAAGISRATPDPDAGRIDRDARGEPTGLLREAATELVNRVAPPTTAEEYEAGLVRALAALNRVGIVSFVEASARAPMVDAYRAVARAGRLTARAHLSLYADPTQDASQVDGFLATRAAITEPGLTAGAVKIFVDGVIEAATAYLLEPYLPLPGDPPSTRPRGLPNFTDGALAALVTRLDKEGFQTHMHAIGDGAIRQGLDAIAAAVRANGARDRRPHIAHIQLVDPADIGRFAGLGVVANMQPLWAVDDAYIRNLTTPRLGPARSQWLYPFGALHRAGARLAGGSDWSVSSVNPLDAIEVAVTRKAPGAPEEEPSWLPDQRLDLDTALAAYTSGGAYVSFEDDSGSLEAGKLADLIVLDRNPFEIPARQIHEARVLWTLLEGREVFRAEGFTP
ncbi:MAG: amidohydrolase [Vicinamibacterales bacterium]